MDKAHWVSIILSTIAYSGIGTVIGWHLWKIVEQNKKVLADRKEKNKELYSPGDICIYRSDVEDYEYRIKNPYNTVGKCFGGLLSSVILEIKTDNDGCLWVRYGYYAPDIKEIVGSSSSKMADFAELQIPIGTVELTKENRDGRTIHKLGNIEWRKS